MLEQEFVNGLSPSTGYQRLMSARRLSLDELRRFTDIDHKREGALIATTLAAGRERQIGVARYVKEESSPGVAEFAIVLSDDWHRRGLETRLLVSLLIAAKGHGVRRLVVIKLLAKTAEDRYQTAAGLERDLRRCLTQCFIRLMQDCEELRTRTWLPGLHS